MPISITPRNARFSMPNEDRKIPHFLWRSHIAADGATTVMGRVSMNRVLSASGSVLNQNSDKSRSFEKFAFAAFGRYSIQQGGSTNLITARRLSLLFSVLMPLSIFRGLPMAGMSTTRKAPL